MMRGRIYEKINGLIGVFKPSGLKNDVFLANLQRKLKKEKAQRTKVIYDEKNSCSKIITVEDLAVSPLGNFKIFISVIGSFFKHEDFILYPLNPLTEFESGLQVLGIGANGCEKIGPEFEQNTFMKTYQITGRLGRSTSDGTIMTKPLHRTKYHKILKRYESAFSSSAILHAGVQPNTTAAYLKLCSRWRKEGSSTIISDLRPKAQVTHFNMDSNHLQSVWERQSPSSDDYVFKTKAVNKPHFHQQLQNITEEMSSDNALFHRENAPYVHNLRCIHFNPPEFVVEMQVCHETEEFFINFIANLAPLLKSATHTAKIRRLRHGPIGLQDALVYNQFRLLPSELCREDVDSQKKFFEKFLHFTRSNIDFPEESDDSRNLLVPESEAFMRRNDTLLSNVLLCTHKYYQHKETIEANDDDSIQYSI